MTPLEPLERDFVQVTLAVFSFLLTEWECTTEIAGAGSSEVTVLFRNRVVGIEVMLADETHILLKVIPLRAGRLPRWFDDQLRDQYTGFPLSLYLETVDPEWHPPERRPLRSASDIEAELRPYADALRRHGDPLRVGDPGVFAQMEDLSRRRLIATYLTNWQNFAERVRLGFNGPVTEYVGGVVARSQLQSFLETWKGQRTDDPLEEIRRADQVFDDATEPVEWDRQRKGVIPPTAAQRWWRRPKWLTGALREYFLRG